MDCFNEIRETKDKKIEKEREGERVTPTIEIIVIVNYQKIKWRSWN